MYGSDSSIEKVFEAHRISRHPRKHTITPYNSSDAGLTAAAAAAAAAVAAAAAAHIESARHILFSARQQRVPSSDGSSACYRLPFCNTTAAAAVLALVTLHEFQRHNREDERDEGSPRAKRTLCSRKRQNKHVYLSTASSWMQKDSLEPARRTGHEERRSFQLTFTCPNPAYQTPQKEHKNNNKTYKLDPTDDKEGIQTHAVE